jgi:hypothetical protein
VLTSGASADAGKAIVPIEMIVPDEYLSSGAIIGSPRTFIEASRRCGVGTGFPIKIMAENTGVAQW